MNTRQPVVAHMLPPPWTAPGQANTSSRFSKQSPWQKPSSDTSGEFAYEMEACGFEMEAFRAEVCTARSPVYLRVLATSDFSLSENETFLNSLCTGRDWFRGWTYSSDTSYEHFKNHKNTTEKSICRANLVALIQNIPVEDGVAHEGEVSLRKIFQLDPGESGAWLISLIANDHSTSSAAMLRLLGRISEVPRGVKADIIKAALASDYIELRDAAIQAADLWQDPNVLDILRSHNESASWLRLYLSDVISDLEAASGDIRRAID